MWTLVQGQLLSDRSHLRAKVNANHKAAGNKLTDTIVFLRPGKPKFHPSPTAGKISGISTKALYPSLQQAITGT